VSPGPALALLGALAAAALLADRTASVAAIAALLIVVCLRAPAARRWPYLAGSLVAGASVFLLTPFVETEGYHELWVGPTIPVLGTLDVTVEELGNGAFQGLRLAAVGLAFATYALLLDHDRIVSGAGRARRSALAVALATRVAPTLERDARGLLDALRGRGVAVAGIRGHARLVSPLVAGSLERGLSLAESMEARGYGRPGHTRTPQPPWGVLDRAALVVAPLVVAVGALWL
jgi:energy-coupling factor transporter transmembrane protein EcfT